MGATAKDQHSRSEPRRVLVVDDDGPSRDLIREFLEREGCVVTEAADGPAALRAATETRADVIILDLGLPGLDGLDVLKAVRRASGVPVIVVTGRAEEVDKLSGFDAGADDYLVKPFSLPELAARVRAVLSRGEPTPTSPRLEYDGLVIDVEAASVALDGSAVELTHKEYGILVFLAAAPGRCVARDELLHHVWGSTPDWQDSATVTEHIRRLRKKIDPDPDRPRFIETVRGHGYRFAAPER